MYTRTSQRAPQGSALQIYLQEINDTPLLSADEERTLAAGVAAGDPYARDHMVKANLRLVVLIAREFLGRGVCLEDLIAEGNLGLMRAVEGFDPTRDIRFSTYAGFWIKQSIRRAVMNQGRPIRLPAHMVKLLAKWKRAKAILSDRLGRTPTPNEIGEALRLSRKKLEMVRQAIEVDGLIPRIEGGEDEDSVLEATLTDERCRSPQEALIESDEMERVFDQIGRLEDRDALVIRMRFGLESYSPMSLREVGENLGLTRERVRQLGKGAMEKLMASV